MAGAFHAVDSSPKDDSVLVAVLNWNRPRETIKCLESVADLNYRRHAVLVVDNGSAREFLNSIVAWADRHLDGFREVMPESLPQVPPRDGEFMLYRNASNLGYTGGNNIALTLARIWRFR